MIKRGNYLIIKFQKLRYELLNKGYTVVKKLSDFKIYARIR